MAKQESPVKKLTTRVRQLILRYKELKNENEGLYTLVDERDKEIAALKAEIASQKSAYEALKSARMLEVTDGDLEMTKKRLTKLIRDVDQCITMLSEKDENSI